MYLHLYIILSNILFVCVCVKLEDEYASKIQTQCSTGWMEESNMQGILNSFLMKILGSNFPVESRLYSGQMWSIIFMCFLFSFIFYTIITEYAQKKYYCIDWLCRIKGRS